jgi:hypothetical protein
MTNVELSYKSLSLLKMVLQTRFQRNIAVISGNRSYQNRVHVHFYMILPRD